MEKELLPAAPPAVLIEAKNLRRVYGSTDVKTIALADASLSVSKGEFISIVGSSGSGKSTLLHILGLLDRPTAGSYKFSGNDTLQLTDEKLAQLRNQTIGFIFQAFHLLARTTVLENVILPLEYSDHPPSTYQQRALAALEKVKLTHRLEHQPHQLSGGEKQRVAIARALVNDPTILFADEPTGNLDSVTGASVIETLKELHKTGHTVILVTHEKDTAQQAERIITVSDGKIISDQPGKKFNLAT